MLHTDNCSPDNMQNAMESNLAVEVKPRVEDAVDKIKTWKLTEIMEPSQCRTIRLPDNLPASKVNC